MIPANDEAHTIRQAVAAVRLACAQPVLSGLLVRIVVVDDSSADLTGELAASALDGVGDVIRVEARNAGTARRAGFAEICRLSAGLDDRAVWFATTDSDTIVSPDWLIRQLAWRAAGAEAVAGLVTALSWREQPSLVRRRYEQHMARFSTSFGHPHVYGANLGLSKDAYLCAGGMSDVATGEDHALWDSVGDAGFARAHVSDVVVATSTRREGRAPDGFSALLRSLGEPL